MEIYFIFPEHDPALVEFSSRLALETRDATTRRLSEAVDNELV
jgi:hypothetical protein